MFRKKTNLADCPPYTNGKCFSPKVDCELLNEKSGRLKWWYDEYFETDQYLSRDYAISEMIGYLEGLEVLIKAEIDGLKQMMDNKD